MKEKKLLIFLIGLRLRLLKYSEKRHAKIVKDLIEKTIEMEDDLKAWNYEALSVFSPKVLQMLRSNNWHVSTHSRDFSFYFGKIKTRGVEIDFDHSKILVSFDVSISNDKSYGFFDWRTTPDTEELQKSIFGDQHASWDGVFAKLNAEQMNKLLLEIMERIAQHY